MLYSVLKKKKTLLCTTGPPIVPIIAAVVDAIGFREHLEKAHPGDFEERRGNVDALVSAGPGHFDLPSTAVKHLLEKVADQDLEVLPLHGHQVLASVESIEDVESLDKSGVFFVEFADRTYRLQSDHL